MNAISMNEELRSLWDDADRNNVDSVELDCVSESADILRSDNFMPCAAKNGSLGTARHRRLQPHSFVS